MQDGKPPRWLLFTIYGFALISIFGIKFLIVILIVGLFFFPPLRKIILEPFSNIFQAVKKEGINISNFQSQNTKESSKPFSSSFSNPMSNFQFKPGYIFGIIFLLLIAIVIIDGFISVPPGSVGVIYSRGSGVLEEEIPEGLHLKIPFWEVATIMDVRLQTYTMSIATNEGERIGDDSIEALTKDGQRVDIDVTIQYKIDRDQAAEIYRDIGPEYADKVVRPEVRSVIREVVTGFESKQLFDIESRQKASLEMEELLRAQYAESDIELIALLLRNVRFSEVYLHAIEEKQVAEQQIQKSEFERQEAEIRAQRVKIDAKGEADALREKGMALREYPEIIQLEMINKLSPAIKWGILPDTVLPLMNISDLNNS